MKLIYILSSGHSGSTVLGSILGNHKDVFHIGEFANFYKVIKGELETCSCGKLPADCELWSDILEFYNKNYNAGYLYEYERIRNEVENNILKKPIPDEIFANYKKYTEEIFRIISQVTNKDFIVDSSKSPSRALALSKVFKNDLAILYLRKDYKEVLSSFKKKRKSTSLNTINLQLNLLKQHYKFRYVMLRAKSKSQLFGFSDIFSQNKINGLFKKLEIHGSVNIDAKLRSYHVIAGNRMRFNETFKVELKHSTLSLNHIERVAGQMGNIIRKIY